MRFAGPDSESAEFRDVRGRVHDRKPTVVPGLAPTKPHVSFPERDVSPIGDPVDPSRGLSDIRNLYGKGIIMESKAVGGEFERKWPQNHCDCMAWGIFKMAQGAANEAVFLSRRARMGHYLQTTHALRVVGTSATGIGVSRIRW